MITIDMTKDWLLTVPDTGSITYSAGVSADIGAIDTGETATVYTTGDWNIADSAYISLKVTSRYPPSNFTTYRFYLKDFGGRGANYYIGNNDIGKELRIPLATLSYESGFNRSSVAEVGLYLSSPKSAKSDMALKIGHIIIGDVSPTYTTAQDVVNQIGIIDPTTGDYLAVSATTRPSLAVVERWIMEAESYIDGRCRMSWRESVAKNIILDRPEYWKNKKAGTGRNPFMTGSFEGGMVGKGHPFKLPHRNIREFDADKGDKVEMRGIGQTFTDVTSDTDAYWFDYNEGRLYLRKWAISSPSASLRVTYRYGHEEIPEDIRRATKLKAALNYLQTDWFRGRLPQGPDLQPNKSETVREWQDEIEKVIAGRQSVSFVGGI